MQSPFSKMERLPGAIRFQQPLSKMFEKASSLLGLSNTAKAPALDGEIVYSKNNVCVHQTGSDEPAPGYLSLRCSTAEKVSEYFCNCYRMIPDRLLLLVSFQVHRNFTGSNVYMSSKTQASYSYILAG